MTGPLRLTLISLLELIPKGSKLLGSYSGATTSGQTRVLISWNRLIRPDGIDIQINANVTDQYTCSKCGGKKHTVIMLQTRSADEPMTQFITCTNCGFTFKQ